MGYSKEQKEAVESLIFNLDELDCKPRRLYYALEKLAFAFDIEHAIPSIREAQDVIYNHINEGDTYEELFTSLREYKIEEWKYQVQNRPDDGVGRSSDNIRAAENFLKKHINRLTERRFY